MSSVCLSLSACLCVSFCVFVGLCAAAPLTSSTVQTVLRQSLILDWKLDVPGDDKSSLVRTTKSEILIRSGMSGAGGARPGEARRGETKRRCPAIGEGTSEPGSASRTLFPLKTSRRVVETSAAGGCDASSSLLREVSAAVAVVAEEKKKLSRSFAPTSPRAPSVRVRVEVRQPSALLSAQRAEGRRERGTGREGVRVREQTPSSRGNVCASLVWRAAERVSSPPAPASHFNAKPQEAEAVAMDMQRASFTVKKGKLNGCREGDASKKTRAELGWRGELDWTLHKSSA